MPAGGGAGGIRAIAPFAALSASYFAHIGFFNPYLTLWLKHLGLPIAVIALLASVQSVTRVFAPYLWGMLSDHTGERVRLLRWSACVAFAAALGFWWPGGPWWIGLVLLVVFTHTSSMMSLTEAAMAHLVAGDWGRYGRIRLWGSAGFMATVVAAGAWFDHFGMGHFTGWTTATLAAVVACTFWLPDAHDRPEAHAQAREPVGPVLRQPVVRWFFASLLCHVMAHYAIYGYFSLYLDAHGYGKATIGLLWAVSVLVEIAWFFWQGRLVGLLTMPQWLVLCGAATALRMTGTGLLGDWLLVLFIGQVLHALTFAAHHTACIAMVTYHFPGRLRARGQALFTVVGYGIGGVVGVLAGGRLVDAVGYEALFLAAGALGALAVACAWQVRRHEERLPEAGA
ncbi:MFS transporter [Ramlibacter sp. MAHUQ-53]|uniref:MFS transporter n=1 Tax=unclassified Ramlibacter TaxID=2617605 RepID=UPI0036443769